MVHRILLMVTMVALSGCSLILPRSHDPVMFGNLVDVVISVDKLTCSDKVLSDWNDASNKIHRLAVYSDLRKDPQANSIIQLQEAVGKARDSKSVIFCDGILKVNRTRIDVITDAWRGR